MLRALVATVCFFVLTTMSLVAEAWTEARPSGVVTEMVIGRDGMATVTVRVHWRVIAGKMHGFELTEMPVDLELSEASAVTAEGVAIPITARMRVPGRLELAFGDERGGVRRGAVDVVVRYVTSLRASGALRREGDAALVDVATSPWERGIEAAELRVSLPSGARRAYWVTDQTPGVETFVGAGIDQDVLRAVRRHVPTGLSWRARIVADPRVFPWLSARATTTTVQGLRPRSLPVGRALAFAFGVISLGVLGAVLLARLRSTPRPGRWVTPTSTAALVVGALAQSSVLLGVDNILFAGTVLLLFAAVVRTPLQRPTIVGPATWEPRTIDQLTPPSVARPVALSVVFLIGAAVMVTRPDTLARLVSLDLALCAALIFLFAHTRHGSTGYQEISPVVRSLQRTLGRTKTSWHQRSEFVRATLSPREVSWRESGLIAVLVETRWSRGWLGPRAEAVVTLRAQKDSPAETVFRETVRHRAHALTLEESPTTAVTELTLVAVGPDTKLGAMVLERARKAHKSRVCTVETPKESRRWWARAPFAWAHAGERAQKK